MSHFMDRIDEELRRKSAASDRDHSYFHPSSFGGCPVEVWMNVMGIEPDSSSITAQNLRVFDEGHFLHLRYQMYMRDAGILCKDEVVSISQEDVQIGGTKGTKVMLTGSSGRAYPYEPEEYLWKVTEPDASRPKMAGMESPVEVLASDMKPGDEFWLVEVPLLDREYHFGGHADAICVDQGEDAVVDFKSKSEFSYARMWYDYDQRERYQIGKLDPHMSSCHICGATMKNAKDLIPHLETNHPEWTHVDRTHKIQLHIYMWLLNTNRSLLVSENKSRQAVHVQVVPREEDLVDRIKSNASIIWEKAQNGERPEIPYQSRKQFPCGWCDYSSKCWS